MNMSLASLSHATYHDIRLSPEHSVTGLGVAEREAFPRLRFQGGLIWNTYLLYPLPSISEFGMPVRYLALESLAYNRFSEKSDVWAFAVFALELLTDGMVPYFEVDERNLVAHVNSGNRLSRVHIKNPCPDELWTLMESCWEAQAARRPTFSQLSISLAGISKIEGIQRLPDWTFPSHGAAASDSGRGKGLVEERRDSIIDPVVTTQRDMSDTSLVNICIGPEEPACASSGRPENQDDPQSFWPTDRSSRWDRSPLKRNSANRVSPEPPEAPDFGVNTTQGTQGPVGVAYNQAREQSSNIAGSIDQNPSLRITKKHVTFAAACAFVLAMAIAIPLLVVLLSNDGPEAADSIPSQTPVPTPSPQTPEYVVEIAFALAMSISDFTTDKQLKFKDAIAAAADVQAVDITIDKIVKTSFLRRLLAQRSSALRPALRSQTHKLLQSSNQA